MVKLNEMSFDLIMDRDIDKDKYYISPGGYTLNGKDFDFFTFEGNIDDDDRNMLHVDVYYFDDGEFEPIVKPDISGEFQEFFVYTGEYNDPEINPVKIENLKFYWDDASETLASDELLLSANNALTN